MKLEIAATGGIVQTIIKSEASLDYPAVAKEFRIIQSDTRTIIVDHSVAEKLIRRERVATSEILGNSVQLWADKIEQLGMSPIFPGSELYQWNAPYDPNLLGVMKGILPLAEMKQTGTLIIDNNQ